MATAALALLEVMSILAGKGLPGLGIAAALCLAISMGLFLKNAPHQKLWALALRLPYWAIQNTLSALAGISKKQQGRFIHTSRNA
jgi:hypothetical protein